jgi:hypothetical protein
MAVQKCAAKEKISYNSAVFGSVSSNDYMVFSVAEPFLDDFRNCKQGHATNLCASH